MLKKIFIFFLLITTAFSKVYWFGYYEAELDYISLPDQQLYTNYHKLRLDMDVSPSNNIRIAGNVIYKHFEGETEYDFMNFLPEYYHTLRYSDGEPIIKIPSFEYNLQDTLFIDNIFLELHHQYFDLIIGKQQLPTGSGYAWNPTDIFNTKDIFDPTYENRGVNAFQLKIPLGVRYNLTGIIEPAENVDEFKQYYEIKAWLGNFDIALSYSRSQYDPTSVYDLLAQYTDVPMNRASLVLNPAVTREIAGFDAEGELLGLGVRTEIAANRLNFNNDALQYEYIVGADYTFRNSLYVMSEYYHNDFGAPAQKTELINYLNYFNYEIKSLNQNYILGMVRYPITDLIDVSLSSIANLDDESMAINPKIVYRIYQDVELTLFGNYFYGNDQRDEFGYQEAMVRLRLRAYF